MDNIYLSFIWHMHQPYYKNLYSGEYMLPWVLLHGTKDYYDMPFLLKEFDGIKQNFNFVPSLLLQLIDYEDLNVKDTYLEIFKKKPKDLSENEKVFLLVNFFNANWDNMIKPFPRYYELLRKRGFYYPKEHTKDILGYFNDEDFQDIQVLFFLSWIDPMFYERNDDLKYLKSKGKGYSEDDKRILENVQKDIIKGIIPLCKELSLNGTIELSTSPFYHPIIPLLIDNRIARDAMPNCSLPEKLFASPKDASAQISKAKKLFNQIFQFDSKGMWPPEGSVSEDALQLYMEHGIEWVATDEEILYKSLNIEGRRDNEGFLINPEVLYRPYRFEKSGKEINMVFRDKYLSDLISFHYSKSDPKDAATDLIRRVKKIGESVKDRLQKPLVAIVMDGENAWESYRNDGRDFFNYLYEGILKEKDIVCQTVSEILKDTKDVGILSHCFAGSWISNNFSIWIGHVEDNTSWTLLAETRDFLEMKDPDGLNQKAWESLYVAEGSDWNWWYGDEHSSDDDEMFDILFRENLSNIYRFLGEEPPEKLSIPVILKDREVKPAREPMNFIHPKIDGGVSNYFEWMGSGFMEGKGHGAAMHDSVLLMKGFYFGFDEQSLYIRIDVDKSFIQNINDLSFEITIEGKDTFESVYHVKGGIIESPLPLKAAFTEILEIGVAFESLGVCAGDKINIWSSLKIKEMPVDRIPVRGYLTIKVPSEDFEMEMWYV
jgi:alpha-amylase/alpha-mannosidase (GH57 family)